MIFKLLSITPKWTILNSAGRVAVEFDTFIDFSFSGESPVSSEPVEKGTFASYNKSNTPDEIKATLAATGDYAAQERVKAALMKLRNSTELVSLVTPTAEYKNFNLTKFDFTQAAGDGAGMLVAKLGFLEVRNVQSKAYTQSKNMSHASTQNTGKKQPRSMLKTLLG